MGIVFSLSVEDGFRLVFSFSYKSEEKNEHFFLSLR